jgi:hypothetical protein
MIDFESLSPNSQPVSEPGAGAACGNTAVPNGQRNRPSQPSPGAAVGAGRVSGSQPRAESNTPCFSAPRSAVSGHLWTARDRSFCSQNGGKINIWGFS